MTPSGKFLALLAIFGCSLASTASWAQELSPSTTEFFEKRVRPVFVEHCEECHSGEEPESEFNIESLTGLLHGGTRGPALVPGEPEQSLLILAINHADQLHMPPKSKMPATEIADLTAWVKAGAIWPDAEPVQLTEASPSGSSEVTDEQRAFWSFQPPLRVSAPAVRHPEWIQSPIDRFILSRLEAAGLQPAPPVAPAAWLRRVTFDLTGLPPTPEEASNFLSDPSPDAKTKVVERLLSSPRYGERWGRHWLDIARYADSNGLDENLAYAHAYRYRDYVIGALNHDKPYNRFLVEQIAGDLLPLDDPTPLAERLVATGFLSLGAKMLAEDDPVKMQMDIIDEQIDTLGRAVLGMTLGCARCHDHKFDPVPTADYYALAGIFKSTRTMENFKVVARWQERPLADAAQVAARDAIRSRLDDINRQIQQRNSTASSQLISDARRHAGDYLLAAQHELLLSEQIASTPSVGDAAANVSGALVIEAEEYSRGNVLKDSSAYGPGIGVLVNAGQLPNFTEYEIAVPAAGIYQIELRFAAAEARPCKLLVNGRLLTTDAAADVTGGWYPEQQQWRVEAFVELQSGMNVLRLEQPNCFPHIDKILLAPAQQIVLQPQLLDAQYALIPEITAQWIQVLRTTSVEAHPLLALWRERAQGRDVPPPASLDGLGELPSGKAALPIIAAWLQSQAVALESEYQARLKNEPSATPPAGIIADLLYGSNHPFQTSSQLASYYPAEVRAEISGLESQQAELTGTLPSLPETMAVSEDAPQNVRIHIRGSHITLGTEVPRGFPRVLVKNSPPSIPADRSGRLELAEWLTRPDHPLTARVIVNRVWQAHFGEGLVRSPDNFGTLGEPPTHPELLDDLALRFVEEGWSLKALHRLIVLSSTYEMSTQWKEAAANIDPENRLFWRYDRRRLEAEAIRDSILAVSGTIDLTMGGTMLPTKNREYVTSTANVDPVVYRSDRRSVYLPVVRSALYDVFQAFDFPDPSVSNGRRDSTTVAPQALFMMNSQFVSENTRRLATSLRAQFSTDEERIRSLFPLLFTREVTDAEMAEALAFVNEMRREHQAAGLEEAELRAWQSLCRAMMSTNEFIYIE